MTPDEFFNKYNGRYLEYNNDRYKFQCMDLFWQYLKEVLNLDTQPYQGWGTAKNCYNNFNNIKGASQFFTRISNGPVNYPTKGDTVFWGFYLGVTGLAGHVAICSGGNAKAFISFDQNYPTGSPCKFVNHSYRGVIGWLHPKTA
jgi:hypothetical protein